MRRFSVFMSIMAAVFGLSVFADASPAFAWHANSECPKSGLWSLTNPSEEWATNATFTFNDTTVISPVEPGQSIAAPPAATSVTVTWDNYGGVMSYTRPADCTTPTYTVEEDPQVTGSVNVDCKAIGYSVAVTGGTMFVTFDLSSPDNFERTEIGSVTGTRNGSIPLPAWATAGTQLQVVGSASFDSRGGNFADQTFTVPACPAPSTTAPSPSTTVPVPTTTAPSPSTTVPAPTTTAPAPSPSTTVPEQPTPSPTPGGTLPVTGGELYLVPIGIGLFIIGWRLTKFRRVR